jgi:glucose-6-phosphate isomerase
MDQSAVAARHQLTSEQTQQIERALSLAIDERWARRIWDRDASLWTDDGRVAGTIGNRLGWLDAPSYFDDRIEILEAFAEGMRAQGFAAALVCGMGGSSLAPEVLALSLPLGETGIPVSVLDSTDPVAVRAGSTSSDPAQTLYLIASKSGTTAETNAFLAHFWQLEDDVHADIPSGLAGEHFVAISDPGRSVESIPHQDLFRESFLNPEDVGGRYSALTYVGLVPAALMNLDVRSLIEDAGAMAGRCATPDGANPGVWLGAALGALAANGRDKLTLVIEPRYASLGNWIEQLVAESTGKRGVGIVPVVGEALGDPDVYGDDRVFVRISTGNDTTWHASTTATLDALAAAGHPVIELEMNRSGGSAAGALGAEFFRWEFATAVAGAVLGINPFDEPNVTESKDNTRRVLDEYGRTGSLPEKHLVAESGVLRLYGDAPLRLTADAASGDVGAELRRHIDRCRPNGFFGVQAYICATPERDAALRGIAQLLRDRTRRAVTTGYGPRFLHSTGQLHKGGAPIGCFLQLTADYAEGDDLPIPGWRESFGTLIGAQAAGDFISLESHELPVISISLSADPDAGLAALRDALEAALD